MHHRLSVFIAVALLLALATPAAAQPPVPPDGPATLVKDINTRTQSSLPQSLTSVGTQVFFTADDDIHGRELWVSDGPTSARMVSDLRPGSDGSDPRGLTNFNGMLFFTAYDGVHGTELWRSDGTAVGTVLVADIVPGQDSFLLHSFTPVGNTLFFMATHTAIESELWKTDGTAAGTVRLKDGFRRPFAVSTSSLAAVGTTLFFFSDDTSGLQLWKSDGTSNGTVQVMQLAGPANVSTHMPQIGGEPPGPQIRWAINFNGALLFVANGSLWRSDGTAVGTRTVHDALDASAPAIAAGRLFFNDNTKLWVSDGTTAGTQMVRDFSDTSPPYSITSPVAARGAVFLLRRSNTATELWTSDGTENGTRLITTIGTDMLHLGIDEIVTVNHTLFFPVDAVQHGRELWRSDGTEAGTSLVKDIFPDADSDPKNLTYANGHLFFVASDPRSVDEVWSSDGTEQGTQLVHDINPSPLSSDPEVMGHINGVTFFAADDGVHGRELWRSDGSASGTMLLKDIATGPASSILDPVIAAQFHDQLFFVTYNLYDWQTGTTLWRTDGTVAGTVALKNFPEPDGNNASSLQLLIVVRDTLFFTFRSTLWRSDGTQSGTTQVADIGDFTYGQHATDVNGTLFFTVRCSIWKSDGTQEGTVLVKEFDSPCGGLDYLTGVGDTLYFVHADASYTCTPTLWKSDGTEVGTVLIKAFDDACLIGPIATLGTTLFFGVTQPDGSMLWRSDGTEAGTQSVKAFPERMSNFTAVGNQIFFVHNLFGIPELWVSDGTAEGTHIATTFGPGMSTGSLASIANILVFGAPDASGGYGLYRSDGTTEGTQLVQAFMPSVQQISYQPEPHAFFRAGDHLFFSADGGTGEELWAISISDGIATALRPTPMIFAQPGGTLSIPARYDSTGLAATAGLTLTATLDSALTYLDASGEPAVDATTLTWRLPDLGFLAHGTQQVRVRLPDAPVGTRYIVTWTLNAPGDATPEDDTRTVEIVVAHQTFLPLLDH